MATTTSGDYGSSRKRSQKITLRCTGARSTLRVFYLTVNGIEEVAMIKWPLSGEKEVKNLIPYPFKGISLIKSNVDGKLIAIRLDLDELPTSGIMSALNSALSPPQSLLPVSQKRRRSDVARESLFKKRFAENGKELGSFISQKGILYKAFETQEHYHVRKGDSTCIYNYRKDLFAKFLEKLLAAVPVRYAEFNIARSRTNADYDVRGRGGWYVETMLAAHLGYVELKSQLDGIYILKKEIAVVP